MSVHASHAWTWYEGSQRYDGKLTKADGKGKWWEGYDPQDLYQQSHERSKNSWDVNAIHSQWGWGNGASQPTEAFKINVYNRTLDLVNRYSPDVLYFDDTVLPFYPISDEGVRILAHIYNKSLKDNKGEMRAVVTGKILEDRHKEAMVWDVERGIPDRPQAKPWQTCTCLGSWHYDRALYDRNGYKSAAQVVKMLVDIVSKNGTLLLSVPLRSSGEIDEKEVAILKELKAWLDTNGESIFATRPWTVFGEGPLAEQANPINAQGFNEGRQTYSAADIRYVQKGAVVYATALGWPDNGVVRLETLRKGWHSAGATLYRGNHVREGLTMISTGCRSCVIGMPFDGTHFSLSFISTHSTWLGTMVLRATLWLPSRWYSGMKATFTFPNWFALTSSGVSTPSPLALPTR